jgi:hypothetical protein
MMMMMPVPVMMMIPPVVVMIPPVMMVVVVMVVMVMVLKLSGSHLAFVTGSIGERPLILGL